MRKFVVLDVTVLNRNKDGEFFQVTQQLRFVTASGSQLPMDRAARADLHPPTDLVWIPPGEHRSFQAVYLASEKDLPKPGLAYRGVSKAQVVDLPDSVSNLPQMTKGLRRAPSHMQQTNCNGQQRA
jgi:hypothetical protein